MAELDEVMDDEEGEIITLVDDDGKEVEFYHVATIDYKDEWYVFLQPVDELEGLDDDEVLIYKLGTDEEGEDSFLPIEDEEELQAVFDEYMKEVAEDCECGENCECNGESGCGCDCNK